MCSVSFHIHSQELQYFSSISEGREVWQEESHGFLVNLNTLLSVSKPVYSPNVRILENKLLIYSNASLYIVSYVVVCSLNIESKLKAKIFFLLEHV